MYTRPDGMPYVKPQNIVPARVYIGIKGKMEDGKCMQSVQMSLISFDMNIANKIYVIEH